MNVRRAEKREGRRIIAKAEEDRDALVHLIGEERLEQVYCYLRDRVYYE